MYYPKKNFLATYTIDRYGDGTEIQEIEDRFTSEETAKDYINKNNYSYVEEKSGELTDRELYTYMMKEFQSRKDLQIIDVYEFGEYHIIKFMDTYENENTIHFTPIVNYNKTSHWFNTLDSAIIGALSFKYLEVNEARYSIDFINRMLKAE
jgi:hypothetical protein